MYFYIALIGSLAVILLLIRMSAKRREEYNNSHSKCPSCKAVGKDQLEFTGVIKSKRAREETKCVSCGTEFFRVFGKKSWKVLK